MLPQVLWAYLICNNYVAGQAPEGEMWPREVHGELPVVVEGVAQAVIVAPDREEYQSLAADLSTEIEALTGTAVPCLTDRQIVGADGRTVAEEFRHRPLLLLGNALNNRGLLPLYGRWLDAADGRYPGGEGYELRTVVNPYGTGQNQLVVGASTLAGARRGLQALRTQLRAGAQKGSLILPQMLEVQVGPELRPAFEAALAEVKAHPRREIGPVLTNGHLAEFCNDALRYAWTGERAFAERARGVLQEMNRRFDGYYHGDVRTCDDYALEYAVRGWMILQHAGVLTPEELLETDRNLFHDVPFAAHGPGNIGSRHLASGSMAFFLLVDGLLTYGNPDAAARRTLTAWREGVRAYFRGACRTYRGDVDQAQDYGALENVFRYALHDGYWEYFDSGWADQALTQMLMNVDNFGSYSGVGGYGEAMPGSLHYPVAIGVALPMTAFVKRRGDLRWLYENVPGMGGSFLGFIVLDVHRFDMGEEVPAVPPQGAWLGLSLLMLDEYHDQLARHGGVTDGVGPITLPREQCVDKVMFRGGFGREDPYLLLNGFQGTVMGCLDGNAIIRFCDRGQVWLFQSTQEEGHYTKNAVWVSNGRNTDPLEGCIQLRAAGDLGQICFSSTVLPHYHGTDWERTIFWKRRGAFVVFDRVTVREPGDYVMACTWRSPRPASLHPDGSWQASTESAVFTIRPAGSDPATSTLGDDRFSAEVPWVLRQWKRGTFARGDVADYQNVLFVSTPEAAQDYTLHRLNDRAALLRGTCSTAESEAQELSLLTVGDSELSGPLQVQAELAWIGSRDLAFVGLRSLIVGGKQWLHASAALDLSLWPTEGGWTGYVQGTGETELTLALPGLTAVALDGGPDVLGNDDAVLLTVPPGRHTLKCHLADSRLERLEEVLETLKPPSSIPRPGGNGEWKIENGEWKVEKREGGREAEKRLRRDSVPGLPVRTLWSYDGLANRTRTVRGVRVASRVEGGELQPGPLAVVGDTFNTAGATWNASQVEVILTLPEETRVAGLRITLFVGNVDFQQTVPNPVRIAEVAVSDDGFVRDVRTVDQPLKRSFHYRRPYYGGNFCGEVVDTVDGLDLPARAVRLRLERPDGAPNIRLGRVQILTPALSDPVPLRALSVSLGEKGPAWAIWNPDDGSLSLLDHRGQAVWQRDLGAAITGVASDDVDGDGQSELAVTTADWYSRLFSATGEEVRKKDWRGLYEATGGKYYVGACPHGVGIYSRPGQAEKELAIGHYYFLSFLRADGTLTRTVEGTACFWQDFLNTGVDLTGDGCAELLCYSETPWQGRVPVVVLDGVKQEVLWTFPAGNGGARLLQMLRIGEEDGVAVGSHKGCGIYSLTRRAYFWYHAGEVPLASFAVADLDGDGKPEMLVGQRDGFLLGINLAGEIVRQVDAGEEITAVGVLSGPNGPVVLTSTVSGTWAYDREWNGVGWDPRSFQRFEAASFEGRPVLLSLGQDGTVELWGLPSPGSS